MIGVLVWLVGGAVAFLAAQLLAFGRFHVLAEVLIASTAAFTAGVAATWLDFGGFAEPDLRAGVFCTLVAFLSIGATRLAVFGLRWQSQRDDDGEIHADQ